MGIVTTDPEPAVKHYGDWPNSQGFDTTYEEKSPVELRIEGNIPAYCAGVLFRTGLGPRSVDCGEKGIFRVNHWFDNFAQIHRFQLHLPEDDSNNITKVTYNSRITSDGLIEKVKKEGRLSGMTFAAKYEPCKTLFQKLTATFTAAWKAPPKPNEVNVGVTTSINFPGVSRDGSPLSGNPSQNSVTSLCTKTDAAVLQMLDFETLEPIGLARQQTLHPELKGPSSGAHAKSDPVTGDVFNFNLQFGRVGTYKVFRTSASTGQTSILATVFATTAYLHSIFLTEHYVILCVWNSHYTAGGSTILWKNNLCEAMAYDDSTPAKWFIIDKTPTESGGRGVVATYHSDPFFGFHSVNAYEETSEDGKTHIIADIPAYQSLGVLKAFYFDNILSDSPTAGQVQGQWGDSLAPAYRRYRFDDIPTTGSRPDSEPGTAIVEWELPKRDTPELPTLNYSVFTKKHRYVYGVIDSGKSTFADSLLKLDCQDRTVKRWSVHGQTAGEAIFIANPEGKEEDDGCLMTVVLDGIQGHSYLLVLDARDFSELGRANVDGVVGFGFHGLHTTVGLEGNKVATPHF